MRAGILTLGACVAAVTLAMTTTTLSLAVERIGSPAGADVVDSTSALRCRVCEELVGVVRRVADGPGALYIVEKLAIPVCRRAMSKKTVDPGSAACLAPQSSDQCKELCNGMVKSFAPALWHIAVRTKLPSRGLCAHMHMCSPDATLRRPRYEQLVAAAAAAPHLRVQKQSDAQERKSAAVSSSASGAAALRLQRPWLPAIPAHVTQVTDAHVDPLYAPGSRTDCGMPLCCQSRWGTPGEREAETAAPRYGAIECDIPAETLVSTARAMSDALSAAEQSLPRRHGGDGDVDGQAGARPVRLAVYTGDSPPHDIWRQSIASNAAVTKAVATILHESLAGGQLGAAAKAGSVGAVALFPVIGNHEGWPVNLFPGAGDVGPVQEKEGVPSAAQVFQATADAWAEFMHGDSLATSSLRAVGYYTSLAAPGLRVMALHTTAFSSDNPYLSVDSAGAWKQLRWADDVLQYAAESDESVLVIGHAAPPHWRSDLADAFNEMVLRYAGKEHPEGHSILAGFMFGHTHHDEWHVLLSDRSTRGSNSGDSVVGDDGDDDARAVYWVAPAVTPFQSASNPSFRIYDLRLTTESGSLLLDDYVQHRADLRAHAGSRLEWKAVYRWTEAYNQTSAAPRSVARASRGIMKGDGGPGPNLYDTFLANRHGGWPGSAEPPAQIGGELFVDSIAPPRVAHHRHC